MICVLQNETNNNRSLCIFNLLYADMYIKFSKKNFSILEIRNELAVTASFVYLKENLNFDSMVDEMIQADLLFKREKEDYVCKSQNGYFKIDKLIKLMIKRHRCTRFMNIISHMDSYRHVVEHITKTRQKGETEDRRIAKGFEQNCVQKINSQIGGI